MMNPKIMLLEERKFLELSFGEGSDFCARVFFILYELVGKVRTTVL